MKIKYLLKNTSILALTFGLILSGQVVSAMPDDKDEDRRASLKSSSSEVVSQIDLDDVEAQGAQAAAADVSDSDCSDDEFREFPVDAAHLVMLKQLVRSIKDMSTAELMSSKGVLKVLKRAYHLGTYSEILNREQLERESAEREAGLRQKAATTIQRMVRGHLVRKAQEREEAATTIQRMVRGHLARKVIEAERKERAAYQQMLEAGRKHMEAEEAERQRAVVEEAERQRAVAEEAERQRAVTERRQRVEKEETLRKQLELERIAKNTAVQPFVDALKGLMEERLVEERRAYHYFDLAYQTGLRDGLSASGYTLDRMTYSLRDHLKLPNVDLLKCQLEGMVRRLLQQTGSVPLREHVIAVLGLKPVEQWNERIGLFIGVPVDPREAPLMRVFSEANPSAMQDAISKLFGNSSSSFVQYMYDTALKESIAENLAKMDVR